jgi:hypothetical protein
MPLKSLVYVITKGFQNRRSSFPTPTTHDFTSNPRTHTYRVAVKQQPKPPSPMEFEPLDEFADKVATIDMDTNTEFLKAKTLFMRLETIINLYSKSNCPPTSLARDSNRKAVLGRTHGITTRAMEWVEGDRALPSRILGWPDTIALLLAIYALSKSAIPLLTVIVDDCKRINQELHDNLDAHAKRMKRLDAELGAEKKPVDEPVDEPAALSPIEKRDISNEKRWTLRLELCQTRSSGARPRWTRCCSRP